MLVWREPFSDCVTFDHLHMHVHVLSHGVLIINSNFLECPPPPTVIRAVPDVIPGGGEIATARLPGRVDARRRETALEPKSMLVDWAAERRNAAVEIMLDVYASGSTSVTSIASRAQS